MHGVPGALRRAGGERGSVELYMQCRVHGRRWRAVCGVRCGQVQGRDRGRGVRRLRGRQVLRGGGSYGRGHMQGVPGALRRAGGERGSVGVRVRGGLHGAERRAVRGVRCRQVQGRDRGGSVHRLRGGQVLWGGGGYGRGRMQGVPSALRRAGGERGSVGVRVHCWLHGTECQHVPELWSMSPGFPSSLVRTNRCSRPPHHCPPMTCGQGHRPHTRSRCWLLPRLSTCPQHSLGSRLLVLHSRHTCLPRTVCTPDWMFDQPPLNVCRLRNRYTPRHPPQP